jgi:hypothetical protein
VLIEVKTIRPAIKDPKEAQDDWSKFERVVKDCLIPSNCEVLIDEDLLGGVIWHNMIAVRSSMLSYSLELEQKIRGCEINHENTIVVLAFWSTNIFSIPWYSDDLQDFVTFYKTGSHRQDDHLRKMEAHHTERMTRNQKRGTMCFI